MCFQRSGALSSGSLRTQALGCLPPVTPRLRRCYDAQMQQPSRTARSRKVVPKRKAGRPAAKRHAERVTITLPPDRAKRIKQAVAEGRADSISAYVAHVLEAYEQKQSFLSEADRHWLQEENGVRG